MTALPCPRCGSIGADIAEGTHDCYAYLRMRYDALRKDRVCGQ